MGVGFVVVSAVGLLLTLNALSPRRGQVTQIPSFFASWITIELVLHHLVGQVALAIWFMRAGVLESPLGYVGLGLSGLSWAGMIYIYLACRHTTVTLKDSFAAAELEADPTVPRYPRLHILFPFLMVVRRGVTVKRFVRFGKAGGRKLRLDVHMPKAPPAPGEKRPVLLQIHGGGWVLGFKEFQALPLMGQLATQGWVSFNIDYRLSPMATWPDHLVDCKRALAWIRDHAEEYSIDPDFICVSGGSAGGHLCALMAITQNDPRYQPGFEDAETSLRAAVPFYGVYDLTNRNGHNIEDFVEFMEFMVVKAHLDDEPEKFADASPLDHDCSGAPPMFVIHGDRDTLAPVADARSFVEKVRAESPNPVIYAEMKGAQHAFDMFPSWRTVPVVEAVERFLHFQHEAYQAGLPPAVAAEATVEEITADEPAKSA